MNIQRLFIKAAFLVVLVLCGASQAHAGALGASSFEPDPPVAVCLDDADAELNGSVKGLSEGKKKRAYDVDLKLFKERSQAYIGSTTASNKKPEFSFDVSGLDEGKYLGVVTVTSKPAHTAKVEITGHVANYDPSLLSTLAVEVFTANDDLVDDLVGSDPRVSIDPDGAFSDAFTGLTAGSYYVSVNASELGDPGVLTFDVHTHPCPPTSAGSPGLAPSQPSEPPSASKTIPPSDPQLAPLFTSIEVDTLPVGEDEELAQTGASHGGLVLFGLALGGAGLLLLRRSRGL